LADAAKKEFAEKAAKASERPVLSVVSQALTGVKALLPTMSRQDLLETIKLCASELEKRR
jgi:hypothetical protein